MERLKITKFEEAFHQGIDKVVASACKKEGYKKKIPIDRTLSLLTSRVFVICF